MKRISLLISVVVLALGCMTALNAAPSIFGMSGLVLTPDDSLVPAKSLSLAVARIFDDGDDLTTYGGAFGLLPNLEVSAVALDYDDDTQAVVNGKFRLLAESVDKPSVTVGILDATQEIADDLSVFVVVSKNITGFADDVSGNISKPVRGSLGFGTGFYDGFFASLDLAVAPKFSIALEYVAGGNVLLDDGVFSGCVRFQPIQNLTIQAGALDFEYFYAGASYNLIAF